MTDKIENQYNPEFDMTPGGPTTTWAEYQLLHAVKQLIRRIENLEDRIADSTRTVQCFCGTERQIDEVHTGYQLTFMYRDSRDCPGCGQYYTPELLVESQEVIRYSYKKASLNQDWRKDEHID